jgi:hypothetical protein
VGRNVFGKNLIDTNLTINVPSDFSSIIDALNYLDQYRIHRTAMVTIQVADGSYNSDEIDVRHDDGELITLQGNTSTPANCTITFNSGHNGITANRNSSLRNIKGFKLVGPGTKTTTGIRSYYGGVLVFQSMVLDNWDKAIDVFANGDLRLNNPTTITNVNYGLRTDHSGVITAPSVSISSVATQGVLAQRNSYVYINGGTIDGGGSATYGVHATENGQVDANSSTIDNCTTGIYANLRSYVRANGVSMSGNGTNYNPNLDTIGNSNSIIAS